MHAVITDGVSLHVCTCTPRFCISGTAWPIVFNFGVWVGVITEVLSTSHGWGASALAHPFSVSQEPIDRMFGLRSNSDEVCKSRRRGDCTYAHASPVSLSRKQLSLWSRTKKKTQKKQTSLSRSLVHRQTWRLTGYWLLHIAGALYYFYWEM